LEVDVSISDYLYDMIANSTVKYIISREYIPENTSFTVSSSAYNMRLNVLNIKTYDNLYNLFQDCYYKNIDNSYTDLNEAVIGTLNHYDLNNSKLFYLIQINNNPTIYYTYERNFNFESEKLNILNKNYNFDEFISLRDQVASIDLSFDVIKSKFPSTAIINRDFSFQRARAKIHDIIKSNSIKTINVLDFGCAPGTFSFIIKNMTGFHYNGHAHLELKYGNNYKRIVNFDDNTLDSVLQFDTQKYATILSDTKSPVDNSKVIVNNTKILNSLSIGGTFIYKTFCHLFQEQNFFNLFESIKIYRSKFSFELNDEIYVICRNYDPKNQYTHNMLNISIDFIMQSIISNFKFFLQSNTTRFFTDDLIKHNSVDQTIRITSKTAEKFLSTLNCDGDYAKLNEEVAIKIANFVDGNDIDFNFSIFSEVGGSGKSYDIINNIKKNKNSIIIVPTRKLKLSYTDKGVRNVYTYNTVFKTSNTIQHVYVDECFQFALGYYYFISKYFDKAKFYLYGDPKQIKVVDFDKVGLNDNDLLPNYSHTCDISARYPSDVAAALTKYSYFSRTNNPIRKSLFKWKSCFESFVNYVNANDILVMCALQDTKKYLSDKIKNVATIHEAEGYTASTTAMYLDYNDDKLLSKNEYIVVVLTRHTNQLITYGECNSLKLSELMYYGSAAEINLNIIGAPIVDNHVYKEAEIKPQTLSLNAILDNTKKSDVGTVIGVLDKFVNAFGMNYCFNAVNSRDVDGVVQGSANVNPDVFGKTEQIKSGFSFCDSGLAKVYDSADKLNTVKTIVSRYGKQSPTFNQDQINELLKHQIKGFNKWLIKDIESVEAKAILQPSPEEITNYFKEYCESFQKKKNFNFEKLDITFDETFTTTGLKAIDFFMKKQDKFKAAQDFFESAKAGQGVNAWNKMLNIIYCCYARAFAANIKLLLKRNVILCNDESDDKFGRAFAQAITEDRNKNYNLQFLENDFTEFDTSNSEATINFDCFLLTTMGVNPIFVQFYREHRSWWKTSMPSTISFKGFWKKHSGEPFTLIFNTCNNMSVSGLLINFERLTIAGFKGDDDAIIGVEITQDTEGRKLIDRLGFKTKLFIRDVIEFIGYVVTDKGFYPDMIRRVCKTLTKVFRDKESFIEYQKAMIDYVQLIRNGGIDLQLTGRTALCAYYNANLKEINSNIDSLNYLTIQDIEILETFYYNASHFTYDELISYNKYSIYV
jgi:nitrogen regulatory protein PII